jgi:hypothetical protein
MARPAGLLSAVKVNVTKLSAPAFTLKTATTPVGWLGALTYRNFPEGASCIFFGDKLIEKGEPATGDKVPWDASIEKTEILFDKAFATYK